MSETAALSLDPDAPPQGIGPLYEVVNGVFLEPTPMGVFENCVAIALLEALALHLAATGRNGRLLMETLFKLSSKPKLQRRPDLAFVSHERWPASRRVPRTAVWDVVPDLAVEVVSPSNTYTEVLEKIGDYFRAGVRRVWVILPTQQKIYDYESDTRVQVLGPDDSIDGGDIVPGFRLLLRDLFAEPGEPDVS